MASRANSEIPGCANNAMQGSIRETALSTCAADEQQLIIATLRSELDATQSTVEDLRWTVTELTSQMDEYRRYNLPDDEDYDYDG